MDKTFFNYQRKYINSIGQSDFDNLRDYLKYDISVYTITYFTTYKGSKIRASGLVAFPDQQIQECQF